MTILLTGVNGQVGFELARTLQGLGRVIAQERPQLTIVADQFGAPTWSRTIAELTANMLSQITVLERERANAADDRSGIYHLTNGGRTSWYEFAREILRVWGVADQTRIVP